MTTRTVSPAFRLSDAVNRALRTALQMGIIVALITVVDAAQSWAAGQPFAWRVVLGAAIAAFAAPFAALLHRLVLDPSSIPSMTPPLPPAPPAAPVMWPPVVTVSTNGTAGADTMAAERIADAFGSLDPPTVDHAAVDSDVYGDQAGSPAPKPGPEALEHVADVELDIPPPPAKARAARAEAAAEVRQAKAKKAAPKKAAPAKSPPAKAAAKKQPAKKAAAARKRG